MCAEVGAIESTANDLINAMSNPTAGYTMSCSEKDSLIGEYAQANYFCGGGTKTPPQGSPGDLGPVFEEAPCDSE